MRKSIISSMAAAAAIASIGAASPIGYSPNAIDLWPNFGPSPEPRRQRLKSVRSYASRSRYMPHIGSKERARHVGKPDGAMHGLPCAFRV